MKNKLIALLLILFLLFFTLQIKAYALSNLDRVYTVKLPPNVTQADIINNLMYCKELYKEVEKKLQEKKQQFANVYLITADINFTIAGMAIINTETMLSLGELENAARDLEFALKKLKIAQLALMPSRLVEARGMLLDASSIPKSEEGIKQLCNQLKEAGFNMIFPEVFRRGYTIYPSNLTDIDPEFSKVNIDVLKVLIREANKNNIEVHPWIWTFRVRSPNFGNPVFSKLPALKAIRGDNPNDEALFLSPAEPYSREYIMLLLKELVKNYSINGILLDYIRYDETLSEDTITVTKFRMEYLKKYGKFPPLKIDPASPLFIEWQLFKEEQVNTMVKQLSEELTKINPSLNIGVSVFRNENYSRLTKMQNWRHWANNLWIDYVASMLYTNKASDLNLWLNWETDNNKRKDWLYPILGAHRFNIPEDIYEQISLIQKRNIPGVLIFALTHFDKNTFNDLNLGPFRKQAYIPHRDVLSSTIKILQSIEVYLTKVNKELNNIEINKYIGNLRNFYDNIKLQNNNLNYLKQLQKELDTLTVQALNLRNFNVNEYIVNEIVHNIAYAQTIIGISIQRLSNVGKFTPPTVPNIKALPQTQDLPKVKAVKINNPPKIDGNLNDTIWQDIPSITQFYFNTGISQPDVITEVKVAYDSNNLYIAFKNQEDNVSNIIASDTIRDSGKMFISDDSVEVFILPDIKNKTNYYHFAVNTINTQFDQRGRDNVKWNANWQSAVKVYKQEWTVEIAIPFKELGIIPSINANLWRINFCRNRFQSEPPYITWSVPYGSYHNADRFGIIEF